MDASPDVLAEAVRAKRTAIDNDLELLRVRLAQADPRRRIDAEQAKRVASRVLPVVAGTTALWMWRSRRRRVDSLERLLVHGLTDLFQGEHQLLPALDRMRRQAWNEELARAFAQHRAETEGHIKRLDRVFRSVGARPKRGSSPAVAAVIAEGEQLLGRNVRRDVKDAWLIATAQRIEHLEIAGYGTARTYAEMLGYTHAAHLLQQTLEEEKAADEKLTHLAERFVNPQSIRSGGPPEGRTV
jgi:ferritin-like metal-binding protein YciE